MHEVIRIYINLTEHAHASLRPHLLNQGLIDTTEKILREINSVTPVQVVAVANACFAEEKMGVLVYR